MGMGIAPAHSAPEVTIKARDGLPAAVVPRLKGAEAEVGDRVDHGKLRVIPRANPWLGVGC